VAPKECKRNTNFVLAPKKLLCHLASMNTPSDIVNLLGRDAIAAAVGVVPRVVTNKAAAGAFPAMWFAALEKLAGHDLPRQCFTFKGQEAAE
jgi:hypothetical protein